MGVVTEDLPDPGRPELTEDEALALVVAMPDPATLPGVDQWATQTAADMAADRGIEAPWRIADLRESLRTIVATPLRDGYSWRFVYLADLDEGGIGHEVAFVDAEGDAEATHRTLVGADVPSSRGSRVQTFDIDGVHGTMCVAFFEKVELGAAPRDGEPVARVLVGQVACAVRRDLPGFGVTDVVSIAESSLVQPLLSSIPAAQHLLAGTTILRLLGADVPQDEVPGR